MPSDSHSYLSLRGEDGMIPLESLGYIVLVVTLVAYLLTESVSGYRASRQG
ncbi:hypothetical protein [Natrialba magadii]|uniref:hypothetical protein n=1 Tax=Natrialba magadii TaxID=13769 RepID=UPI000A52A42D|nr:hypothetical protein [Natrialba magadii]